MFTKRLKAALVALTALLVSIPLVGFAPSAPASSPSTPRTTEEIGKVSPLLPHAVDLSGKLVYKITLDPGEYGTYQRTVEEVLDYMEEIDNYTRGVPKIAILVGFQEGGHDHQFPQWGPINSELTSTAHPEWDGPTALQYLMEQSKAFNTSSTVHVNLVDAYESSPVWDYYSENGLLSRDSEGDFIPGWLAPAPLGQSYRVNLQAAWEDEQGIRKQVDYLFDQLPVIQETGILYTDANGAISASDFDGVTLDEQIEAYQEVVSYIKQRYHVDVVAEYGFDAFYGYMSHGLTWAQGEGSGPFKGVYDSPMKVPSYVMAAGKMTANANNAMRIFGASVQLEQSAYHDDPLLAGQEVARTTVPYLFLNSKLREAYNGDAQYATFSDGVKSMFYSGSAEDVGSYVPDDDDSNYVTIERAFGTYGVGEFPELVGQPGSPEHLFLMEDSSGEVVFGSYPDASDERYHWRQVDGAESGHYRLQNRATGNYLAVGYDPGEYDDYYNTANGYAVTGAREVVALPSLPAEGSAGDWYSDPAALVADGSTRLVSDYTREGVPGGGATEASSAYLGYQIGTSGAANTVRNLNGEPAVATNSAGDKVYYMFHANVDDWTSSTAIAWKLDPVAPPPDYVTIERAFGTYGVGEFPELVGQPGSPEHLFLMEDSSGEVVFGSYPDASDERYHWRQVDGAESGHYRLQNRATGNYLAVGYDPGEYDDYYNTANGYAVTGAREVVALPSLPAEGSAGDWYSDPAALVADGSTRLVSDYTREGVPGGGATEASSAYLGYQIGTSGAANTVRNLNGEPAVATNSAGDKVYYMFHANVDDWTSSTAIAWKLDPVATDRIENKYVISQGDRIYKISTGNGNAVEDGVMNTANHFDVFMPVSWREHEVMAYSDDGSERAWLLPPDWPTVSEVDIYDITGSGLQNKRTLPVVDDRVTLEIDAGQLLTVVPKGTDPGTNTLAASGGDASYLGTDTVTQGDWVGNYGDEGYYIDGGASDLGETVTFVGSASTEFAESTTDDRALLAADDTAERAVSVQSSELHQIVDLDLGNSSRTVSLYLLDWEASGARALVEAIDPVAREVLAAKFIDNYEDGVYVSFAVTDHVQFRLTRIYGDGLTEAGPIGLAGVFVDGVGAVTEGMPLANIYQQPTLVTDEGLDYSAPTASTPPALPPITSLLGERVGIEAKAVSLDNGTISYQWQESPDGVVWTDLVGEDGYRFVFDSLVSADLDSVYRVVVTDERAGWQSSTAVSDCFDLSASSC
ncbi:endo-alpha-N-acetylgalactosaminidase family protein [Herbiconiux moechotypicola]|uniref:Endo-alpha-N-acetylgalactosaminidase domain-containing protein n=1 Tax=Herbiconiux moechotypicola TaxID=637393 RepID=A0ABN3E2G0_9MICO|nr:endo-alpha-N-acetylgalactosaminidase family protein [Herbiconiux moechotypicola]MCS5731535.1 endo-alpha-N-acetylgalactosaminidase family protein [Herbiconiux moechotypicola]